jgi:hypothetical protein
MLIRYIPENFTRINHLKTYNLEHFEDIIKKNWKKSLIENIFTVFGACKTLCWNPHE